MPRPLWYALEAVHDVVYFAPEASTVYAELGLRGWWAGYFASRAAAFGPVGPGVVAGAFHGFAPAMVARAIPAVWSVAPRPDVLRVREDLAALALARALDVPDDLSVVTGLTARLVAACDPAGRPVAAAHAGLPRPTDPLRALWFDATVLREHRGDGHVAALVLAELDGCEANVLMRGLGLVPERMQAVRGWTDEQWAAARDRLVRRGCLDGEGRATEAGRALRADVEAATDRSCAAAEAALDPAERSRLTASVVTLARRIAASGAVTYPNPVGVPAS